MSSTTVSAEVTAYLARVRAALTDLDPAERDDLLEDLEAHLAEVAAEVAEPGDGGTEPAAGLEARLGPPERYAAELRASAGLPPERDADHRPPLRDRIRRLRADPGVTAILAFGIRLRPCWWLVRGMVAAFLLAAVFGAATGLIVLLSLFAVPASVLFGLRTEADPARWGKIAIGVNVLAVLAGFLWVTDITDRTTYVSAPAEVSDESPRTDELQVVRLVQSVDGMQPVTNIYAYAADGTPLEGVYLYDQEGNPIVLNAGDASYDAQVVSYPVFGADGKAVPNVYPQQQSVTDPLDGSIRRQEPPRVTVPALAPTTTPPTTTPPATPKTGAPKAGTPAKSPSITPSPS